MGYGNTMLGPQARRRQDAAPRGPFASPPKDDAVVPGKPGSASLALKQHKKQSRVT